MAYNEFAYFYDEFNGEADYVCTMDSKLKTNCFPATLFNESGYVMRNAE